MTTAKPIIITGSYVQDQRHGQVTPKYNVIQASSVGEAMVDAGLTLASLKTGRARHADKADFQATISRYRDNSGPIAVSAKGLNTYLDLSYKGYHMGRGTDIIRLSLFEQICSNGMGLNHLFFEYRVRHNGATYENLAAGIQAAMGKRAELADMIKNMQSKVLDSNQIKRLIDVAVNELIPANAVNVRHDLNRVSRVEQSDNTLWDVWNRVQENGQLGRVAYQTPKVDEVNNVVTMRNYTARKIKDDTQRATDFNAALFTAAAELLAA